LHFAFCILHSTFPPCAPNLKAVADELRRLRSAGVTQVYVSDGTLARLREVVDRQRGAVTSEAASEQAESSRVEPAQTYSRPAAEPARLPVRATKAAASTGLRWDGQPMAPIPAPESIPLPPEPRPANGVAARAGAG